MAHPWWLLLLAAVGVIAIVAVALGLFSSFGEAKRSINLMFYIWEPGEVSARLFDILVERTLLADLAQAREVTAEEWRKRTRWRHIPERFYRLFEEQV